jgi:putative endonuclease
MLRCGDGSLYTGVAKDVEARLKQHQDGKGSRYTRAHLPVTLAWSMECETWSDGLKEEIRIKRLDREAKEKLVNGTNG